MRTILALATTAAIIFTASLAQAQSYRDGQNNQPQPPPQEVSENQIRQSSMGDLPQKAYPPVYYDTSSAAQTSAANDTDATSFINVLRQLNNF
jgi:hypothetical protein